MTGAFGLACLLALLASAAVAQDAAEQIAADAGLKQQMARLHVPAVSVGVMRAGRIEWERAWGEARTGSLFQAASISKAVAAMAALHMAQYGNFGLDEDVNAKLKSWKVPENGFTAKEKVTLRRLLSHTAALSVHGFPGYGAGEPLPSLIQILNGEPPANTPPIRVDGEPGSTWRYSGGGYVVLQQLMVDRMGWTFPQILERMVLSRIGMKQSTYEQPLPAALAASAVTGHDRGGRPIAGNWRVYPEMAAAGLWTTPHDLALWAIELYNAYHGRSNRVIERTTARQMLTRQKANWGLGVELAGEGKTFRFAHGGSNGGYRCRLLMYVENGDGAVIMTNSDNGAALIDALLGAIGRHYGWPTP